MLMTMFRTFVMQILNRYKSMEVVRAVMEFYGIWPRRNSVPLRLRICQSILNKIAVALFICIMTLCAPIHTYIMLRYDIFEAFESLILFILCVYVLIAVWNLVGKRDQHERVISMCEKWFERDQQCPDKNQSILDTTQKWTNMTLVWHLLIMTFPLFIIFFLTLPLIKIREMILNSWVPYDIKVSPNFEITLTVYELIIAPTVAIMVSATHVVYIGTLVQVIGQFKILRYNLLNIRPVSEATISKLSSRTNATEDNDNVIPAASSCFEDKLNDAEMSLSKITSFEKQDFAHNLFLNSNIDLSERINHSKNMQDSIDVSRMSVVSNTASVLDKINLTNACQTKVVKVEASIVSESIDDKGKLKKDTLKPNRPIKHINPLPVAELRASSPIEEILAPNINDVHSEMERRLIKCVQHQMEIIIFIHEVESLYNFFIMFQFGVNIIATVIIFLWVSMVGLSGFHFKLISPVLLVTITLVILVIFCKLSDMITDESSKVKEAIYYSDWIEASDTFKKNMRIIISMSNQPMVLKTGGFVTLSLETFYNVTKMSFSYFTSLNSMNK